MGLLLVVRRSLGEGGGGGGRDVGKTGLEWGVLWIVLRAWPHGNVDRIAIEGATWGTVHESVDGQSVIHSLSLSLSLSLHLSNIHYISTHTLKTGCICTHTTVGETACVGEPTHSGELLVSCSWSEESKSTAINTHGQTILSKATNASSLAT